MLTKALDWLGAAKNLRRLHAIKTVVWVVMIPVSLLTPLKYSVPFVVYLSLQALVEGSLSSWQAARAEQANDR